MQMPSENIHFCAPQHNGTKPSEQQQNHQNHRTTTDHLIKLTQKQANEQ